MQQARDVRMVNDARTSRGTGWCVGAFIWPRTVLHARSSKLGKVETRVENAGAVRTSPSQLMVGFRRASCVAILWCRWPTVSDALVVIKCSEPSNNLTVSVTRVDEADIARSSTRGDAGVNTRGERKTPCIFLYPPFYDPVSV